MVARPGRAVVAVVPLLPDVPGRSCPLSYRYPASAFTQSAPLEAQTLYVAGGLYGNLEALDAIDALIAQEPQAQLVFNGDYHWFDAQAQWFAQIEARTAKHHRLRGNVETELASASDSAGCGCGYPDDVDDADVERSNRILKRLKQFIGSDFAARTLSLPMVIAARVGEARIGIVHGDSESLAGWRFDPKQMDSAQQQAWLRAEFARCQVDVFASSHTCAPGLRHWAGGGTIVNNGSAGMANLPGTTHGIVSRIGVSAAPSGVPVLHGVKHAGVYIEAVAVHFDASLWQQRFLSVWPEYSDAHTSYFKRICNGPASVIDYCASME
jgi:hypothetical protein